MIDDCWNKIGVKGDCSCPQLETVIHCHNCAVYSAVGRSLLERAAPPGYLQEWTDLLRQENQENNRRSATISVVIFRLAAEWLALPAKLFQEVKHPSPVHTLPHRSNNLLLGLVNVNGEIFACISLSVFLGIKQAAEPSLNLSQVAYERMVVVEKEGHTWVFPVDEIYGVQRFYFDQVKAPPVVIAKAAENYTKGIINWQNKKINFLDDELLFYTLNKKVL